MQKPSVGDIGGVVAECGLFVIQHVVCGNRFLYGKRVIVGHDTHNGVDIKSVYIVGLQFVVDGIEVDILKVKMIIFGIAEQNEIQFTVL